MPANGMKNTFQVIRRASSIPANSNGMEGSAVNRASPAIISMKGQVLYGDIWKGMRGSIVQVRVSPFRQRQAT